MMYCKNCGTEIPKDAEFCPECGQAINSAGITEINKERESQQTRSVAKGILMVIGIILGLLVAIIGMINFSNSLS